ncbi:hypothetical protein AVEN_246495-1, partial [Araneus ventricosus]
ITLAFQEAPGLVAELSAWEAMNGFDPALERLRGVRSFVTILHRNRPMFQLIAPSIWLVSLATLKKPIGDTNEGIEPRGVQNLATENEGQRSFGERRRGWDFACSAMAAGVLASR